MINHSVRGFLFSAILLILISPVTLRAAETKAPVEDLRTAIVQVAKKNIPAVVHIEVTQRQEMAGPALPFENDPFFRFFFDTPNAPKKFKREIKGLGTGMIIDPKGHILTNNHVVAGASNIQVLLDDGRMLAAKLVGSDPKTDLAVIKITAPDPLPHMTFGDSDKIEVGEWVIAIGHPRGLDQTVTQGIISAKHRRGITDPSSYQDFIQTDAAINPGNSGGPLLNLQGEVIGINAAIVSQSGGYEGIGFAIPSKIATHVARELIARGKVERGWLGVSVQDLSPETARSAGLETTRGALVTDVVKDSPAYKAGLKKNDVVIAYQGKEIRDANSLRNEAANTTIGETVKMTLLRSGKSQDITVTIGTLRAAEMASAASIKERMGVDVRPVTSKEASRYGLDAGLGVRISWIDPNGPLGKAGFEVADLIVEANGQPVQDSEGLSAILSTVQPRGKITLLIVDHRTGQAGLMEVVVR
jgi:serine protease Do